MLFELQKAFPYPVLREDINDYVDGGFQAAIEFSVSADGESVNAVVNVLDSVDEIRALIRDGSAVYSIIFECKDTFYRKSHSSTVPNFEVKFDPGMLRGDVTASPFIVAIKHISDFKCALVNPEFGSGPFEFPIGSVIAVDVPSKIYIDRDVFKPTSSLFELVHSVNVIGTMWQVRTGQDRVQIVLSPKIKEKIDRFRNDKKNKAILLNSIYFGAVMECIAQLREQNENEEEEITEKWKRNILHRCENLNINIKVDSICSIAQRLMNDPFSRFDHYLLEEVG
jgi:hypothetical protein